MSPTPRPNVLCLAGHDPSGGAGIAADIEAVRAQGAHPATVITALTRQDTHNAYAVIPTADEEFAAQIDLLCRDMTFHAFKTGLIATAQQVTVIAELAARYPHVPLVVDPVLRAGGGATLAGDPVAAAILEQLLPHADIITPNAAEARLLCSPQTDLQICGQRLAAHTRRALITGGDEPGDAVVNTLFGPGENDTRRFEWPRLPGHFHGSGCTLAAALAARLALGADCDTAASNAQSYTHACLARSYAPGSGQQVPDRWHVGHGNPP